MSQHIVGADEAEMRLDRFLRRHEAGLTQGVIEKLCRTGKIRVDGRKSAANAHLASGETVTLPALAPPPARPKQRHVMALDDGQRKDLEALVLYRDDAVIVLNKPAGLASQGGNGIALHLDGMLDHLRFDGDERPRLVHRLDRDTSGVLVLARGAAAAAKLAAAFRGRDVEKIYWSLLWGVPNELAGRIDLPLKRRPGDGRRTAPAARGEEDAQRAVTEYRILDYAGRKFAWGQLKPVTGRMHQLRAHMLALGTPILGDAVYGAAFAEGFAERLHLHARRLTLPHPEGGTLTVEANPPKHLEESFKRLGFTVPGAARPKRR